MGRYLNREDDDVVVSSAVGSVIFVEVTLSMGVPEVHEEEVVVVLSIVDDEIIQWLIIIGEIRSSGLYTST